jgi:hypothetical protein
MLVVRVTENVRAVQSSYYSSCPWVMSLRHPTLGIMDFTVRLRAVMAALGPPRFALQPSGCHHGPWAVHKTYDPSGWGGVMYQSCGTRLLVSQQAIFCGTPFSASRLATSVSSQWLMMDASVVATHKIEEIWVGGGMAGGAMLKPNCDWANNESGN